MYGAFCNMVQVSANSLKTSFFWRLDDVLIAMPERGPPVARAADPLNSTRRARQAQRTKSKSV